MFSTKAPTEKNERLSYLLDVYKLYHGHINTMFNYFLIISGLIGNACIQAMQKKTCDTESLPIWIALFGALMSVVSLLIHLRSRDMLDTIEAGLKREEDKLFPNSDGFLNAQQPHAFWFQRHKYQFPLTYLAFALVFIGMAVYVGWR